MARVGSAEELPRSKHRLEDNDSEDGDTMPGSPDSSLVTGGDEEIMRETMMQNEDLTKSRHEGSGGMIRRLSRKLTRPDSLDVESMRVKGMDQVAAVSIITSCSNPFTCSFMSLLSTDNPPGEMNVHEPHLNLIVLFMYDGYCAASVAAVHSEAGVSEHRGGVW